MASLINKTPAETYKDLLTVSSATTNQGLETSLKTVVDGEGVESAIQLSTTTLKIPTGKTLEIAGTLNSVNATLTGDLTVGDDLTVSDLISGSAMTLTGSVSALNANITNTTTTNNLIATSNIECGGGYGSTGIRIRDNGNVETNGNIVADGKIFAGTQFNIGGGGSGFTGSSSSPTGLTIDEHGRIDTDEIIVCSAVKTTSGQISSSANNSPKVKLDTATQIALTVDDSGTDKEILKMKEDGEATFKNKAGDTKFTVKNDGRLGLKPKTTTELNAISASAGDLAFDNTLGVFKIWRP